MPKIHELSIANRGYYVLEIYRVPQEKQVVGGIKGYFFVFEVRESGFRRPVDRIEELEELSCEIAREQFEKRLTAERIEKGKKLLRKYVDARKHGEYVWARSYNIAKMNF